MKLDLLNGLDPDTRKRAQAYVGLMMRKLVFWRRESPIASVGDFSSFVETRAKFIAQTTLYGYLKTRAGTRFPTLFEDNLFSRSLDIAKWHIYLDCVADLLVYSAGLLVARSDLHCDVAALAGFVIDDILSRDADTLRGLEGYDATAERITARIRHTPWTDVEDGEAPFSNSQNALVEWAPVAPQLKEFDTEIVINSMRFKWKNVRDQLRERLDADSVAIDWQQRRAVACEG